MNLENFLKTKDNFTKEELKIVLFLLNVCNESLKDNINDIIDSLETCSSVEEFKSIDKEFDKNMQMRKVCNKFYFALARFVNKLESGEY